MLFETNVSRVVEIQEVVREHLREGRLADVGVDSDGYFVRKLFSDGEFFLHKPQNNIA